MAIDFVPHKYQHLIIGAIQGVKRIAVWAGMGLGKTPSTATALEDLSLTEDVYPILVIAPLRVARTTWPQEYRKWNHLKHRSVVPICGALKDRQAALRVKADVYTVNFEQIEWLVEHLGDKWPFRTVVVDEATKLKGFRLRQGTRRAKALARVAHTKIKRIILLTGTPSPNGLQDLWGQMWFVDKGDRLGRTYDAFKQRWFRASHTGFGVEATDQAQEQIQKALGDVCITIDAADWFDLKEPIVNVIKVDLPPAARVLYKNMEKQMFMDLEGSQVEALNAAAKTQKCIAEGTEILTDSGWKPIEQFARGDLAWDGVEWVSVYKLACHGYKSVVDCFGVTMTPDHKVLTKSGWQTAEDINHANACGRFDRESVRLPDDLETRRDDANEIEACLMGSAMRMRRDRNVYRDQFEEPQQGREEILRLQAPGNAPGRLGHPWNDEASGVLYLDSHEISVCEPIGQGLAQLWRSGNFRMRNMARIFRRFLGGHGSDLRSESYDREEGQQRQLRTGQLSVGNCSRAVEQSSRECMDRYPAGPYDGSASRPGVRHKVGNSPSAPQERVACSEGTRLVYDLVNAGPRHRFTVRGKDGKPLIVHNCLQIASGAAYVEGGPAWKKIHDEKLNALEEILEEAAGMPVLVAYHFKSDLERLLARFPQGRHLDKKPETIDAWNRGEIPIMFAHPASAGHGLNLQDGGNILVFFSISWNLEEHQQIIERNGPVRQLQAGHNRPVFHHFILAADTVDELVLERLQTKREIQDILLRAMRDNGFNPIEDAA
jgi:hypothetical protein